MALDNSMMTLHLEYQGALGPFWSEVAFSHPLLLVMKCQNVDICNVTAILEQKQPEEVGLKSEQSSEIFHIKLCVAPEN